MVVEMIKPIETSYSGNRFRSRLEARWAVFFDTIGVNWEYEPEGYELPNGQRYLPDFRVPGILGETKLYEIKPTWPDSDALRKAEAIGAAIIVGSPWVKMDKWGFAKSFTYCIFSPDASRHYVFAECRYCGVTIEWYPAFMWGASFAAPDGAIDFSGLCAGEGQCWCSCRDKEGSPYSTSSRLLDAYTAARSARFEFGGMLK